MERLDSGQIGLRSSRRKWSTHLCTVFYRLGSQDSRCILPSEMQDRRPYKFIVGEDVDVTNYEELDLVPYGEIAPTEWNPCFDRARAK